jgi:hypothetical protein
MSAFYIVGCFAGGWLKTILIVQEPVARLMPDVADRPAEPAH